jgi:hypothetical protein
MNIRPDETKICYNVLTGSIRILSPNGRFDYRRMSEPKPSAEDRIKDLIALLKIVRKLRSRRSVLAGARKKLIEAQLFRRQQ